MEIVQHGTARVLLTQARPQYGYSLRAPLIFLSCSVCGCYSRVATIRVAAFIR